MRLLIAAGGTGGTHLPGPRRRGVDPTPPGAPELDWVGGRRGLEAPARPAGRLPLRRLLLRSLRSVDDGRAPAPRPDPARSSRSRRRCGPARGAAPRRVHDGRLRRDPDPHRGAPPRRPDAAVGGQRHPGSERPRDRPPRVRARGLVRRDLPCARRPAAVLRDGDADPRRPARSIGGGRASASACRPPRALLVVFGGSQAVRRLNAAVTGALPQLVEKLHVIHLTGEDGLGRRAGGARDAARAAADALSAGRLSSARACSTRSRRRISSSGAQARRRSPRPPRSACRWSSCRIPMPARTSARTPPSWSTAGAALFVPDEAFDSAALLDAVGILDDPARHASMAAAARSLGRPKAADAVAELAARLSPSGARCRAGAIAGPSPREEPRDRRPSRMPGCGPSTWSRLGATSAPRVGVKTERDSPLAKLTTMRVGGPADLLATAHNTFELRGADPVRAIARSCRTDPAGPGQQHGDHRSRRARPRGPRPGRGQPRRRRALRRRGRRPDGARRHGDAARRPDRPRVRAGDPGHGRRRRVGERRRARARTSRPCSSRPTSSSPTARRRGCRRRRSASAIGRAASSTPPAGEPPEVVRRRAVPARARRRPTRSRRASTRSGTGARPTSRSACPSAGSSFRNPPDGLGRRADRRGRAEGPAGSGARRV